MDMHMHMCYKWYMVYNVYTAILQKQKLEIYLSIDREDSGFKYYKTIENMHIIMASLCYNFHLDFCNTKYYEN